MSNKFKQVNCILSYWHAPCTRMMSLGFEFCLSHPWKEDNWAIDRSICDNLGMTWCWDAIRLNSSHITHPFTSDPLKTIKTNTKKRKVLHLDKRIAAKGAPRASVGLEARSVLVRQKLKPPASSLLTRSRWFPMCHKYLHISPQCH